MDSLCMLQKSIKSFDPNIPDSLIKQLFYICVEKAICKGDRFINAGEVSKHMAFNVDGLFRYFYVDERGNDFTKGFGVKNKFLISYSALAQNRPSYFSIEALQDSRILMFDFKAFSTMMEKDIRWYPFAFKLLESVYIMKELREKSFLLDDAATRYKEFKAYYADVEDQIKLYYVASFLGITPETLSRLRKNLRN